MESSSQTERASAPPESGLPLGRALRRGWPVVLLVTLAAVLGALAVASREEPRYANTARVLMNPLSQATGQLLGIDLVRSAYDATRTAQTGAVIVSSNEVAEEAARRLGGGWSADSVSRAVEVTAERESNVLAVTATTDAAADSARVADAVAQAAVELRRDRVARQVDVRLKRLRGDLRRVRDEDYATRDNLFDQINELEAVRANPATSLSLVDTASGSAETVRTSRAAVGGLSLFGGLALGLLAALLLDRLRRSLRTESDVRTEYPLPVLGRIPPGGGRSVASYRHLALELERIGSSSRVVCLASADRSQHRPAIAAGLATALAELGHAPVIVELDGRDTSAKDLLGGAELSRQVRVLPVDGRAPRALDERIALAREAGDWILLSAPPVDDGVLPIRAAQASDDVVLVVQLGASDREALARSRRLLSGAGVEPVGLVLTDAPGDGTSPGPAKAPGRLAAATGRSLR